MDVLGVVKSVTTIVQQRDEQNARRQLGIPLALSPMRPLTWTELVWIILGVATILTSMAVALYMWITGYYEVGAAWGAGEYIKAVIYAIANTFFHVFFNVYRAVSGGGVLPYRPMP